jgi:hypothetical protein
MFFNLFKTKKPRVYLGALLVTAPDDWTDSVGLGLFEAGYSESDLKASLNLAINLPSIDSRDEERRNDLALEMVVVKHQSGDLYSIDAGDVWLPLFQRPQVEIKARLYNIRTSKTVCSAKSKKKVSWKHFCWRMLSLRRYFFGSTFQYKDIERLLCLAAMDVLQKLKKQL